MWPTKCVSFVPLSCSPSLDVVSHRLYSPLDFTPALYLLRDGVYMG